MVNNTKPLFLITLCILIIRIVFNQDVFEIKNTFEQSLPYTRFREMDTFVDARFAARVASFWGIFQNPLGGMETILPTVNYAHSFLFDVGFKAGILPCILLVIIALFSIHSLYLQTETTLLH